MNRLFIILVFFIVCFFQNVSSQSAKRINSKEFYSLIQSHPDAIILDTRPWQKYEQDRIKNALPVPDKAMLITYVKNRSREDTVLVYCEKELRSGPAAEVLDSLGFKHIYELKGGLISWRKNRLPLETTGH